MSYTRSARDDLEIQDTRQMSLRPESPDGLIELDVVSGPIVLRTIFDGSTFLQTINYPCHSGNVGKCKEGRRRRAFHSEFTVTERNTLSRYYARFYRWHLVTGAPDRVACRLATLQLLQRAVNFFATV